jgi:Icc-related predicted phosphoesterase
MKIIYLADIHGAFAEVKDLLAATDAQVYIIAGDLVDRPFYGEEMSARYRRLQASCTDFQCSMEDESEDLDDFIDGLLKRTDLAADIRRKAWEYQEATIRARRVLQQKYKILESILSRKGTSRILCLPGNYDMDLQYTSLHGRDLHRHWYHVAEWRIAGYGGADVATPGIPRRYAVPYKADRGVSEMTRFFTETRPDIIVTHKPAHGVHDHVSPMGESGSPELRRFCEENHVLMCLTGHIHDQWGFAEMEGTVYLNPSNFGAVPQPSGLVSEGGFFYTIDTKDRRIDTITLSKLAGGRIHDVVVHRARGRRWEKNVVDPERYGALIRGKNHDRLETAEKRVIQDALRRNMRHYFPGRAPRETIEAASAEIARIAATIEERHGTAIGMDLLAEEGSSQALTALDVVVYIQCDASPPERQDVSHEDGECPQCREVMAAMQAALASSPHVRIVDWIDLNRVILAAQNRNYECDAAIRFAAYRAIGRPLRGDAAAIADRTLNADPAFHSEIEGTGLAYLEIFQNLAGRVENMKVFEVRLRELGIIAPEAFKRKIEKYIYGRNETKDQEID